MKTDKIKNISVILTAALIVFGLFFLHIFIPDNSVSFSERRKLTLFPSFSFDDYFSGEYIPELEDYLLDQFPARESFRSLKAILRFDIFRQKDNNGIYKIGDAVYKIDYPMKREQVLATSNKINEVYEKYLSGMNVFYSVVPDKNYFSAKQNGYPSIDYDKMLSLFTENTNDAVQYIDITDSLSLDDYYRTDTHFIQTSLFGVIEKLSLPLGFSDILLPSDAYTVNKLEPFYGVYYGQSALNVKADTLYYLTSSHTENAKVTIAGNEKVSKVYETALFSGIDGYDIFLSGAQAIINIENSNALSDKELVIFRDSFSSSLSPLLIPYYKTITLVDLRYVMTDKLSDYITFDGQDVLFLYSTTLINSGKILR